MPLSSSSINNSVVVKGIYYDATEYIGLNIFLDDALWQIR